MKKVNKKVKKAYLKALPYICDNCKEFVDRFNEYCPSCGATNSIRNATTTDYDESKTIHKYKAERRKLSVSRVIGLCLIGIGIICTPLGFFFRNKFEESIPRIYLYFTLGFTLGAGGLFLIFIGICLSVCGKKRQN